ncbi:hypothetical protein [Streptomyces sp. BH105]|uniref:hypothetical protein n=1 Tax=Streptomyces sp. BH105 TaxID=3410408 RepID=UPI003CF8A487
MIGLVRQSAPAEAYFESGSAWATPKAPEEGLRALGFQPLSRVNSASMQVNWLAPRTDRAYALADTWVGAGAAVVGRWALREARGVVDLVRVGRGVALGFWVGFARLALGGFLLFLGAGDFRSTCIFAAVEVGAAVGT